MIGIAILNLFFCAFVVTSMVCLLGWGIVSDRKARARRRAHARLAAGGYRRRPAWTQQPG